MRHCLAMLLFVVKCVLQVYFHPLSFWKTLVKVWEMVLVKCSLCFQRYCSPWYHFPMCSQLCHQKKDLGPLQSVLC